jgi:Bacterial regulatory protein, Fis family
MNEKFEGLVDHLLDGSIFLEEAIELLERRMIQKTLERTAGNQSEASKQLGSLWPTAWENGAPGRSAKRLPAKAVPASPSLAPPSAVST